MDENTVMIDLKDVKKKYVIRHKIQKPDSFKGRLKLVARKGDGAEMAIIELI